MFSKKNNTNIILSKRLNAILTMIDPTVKIADIGTDHGYLASEIINNKKADFVIASDLNKKPLENAKKTFERLNLLERIELRQSNGLSSYSVGEVDCGVIAGMGGDLIINILEESLEMSKSIKQLIIQPQRAIASVRKWLVENGFMLVDEIVVNDGGKFYEVLKVNYTGKEDSHFKSLEIESLIKNDWQNYEVGLSINLRSDKSQLNDYLDYYKHRINQSNKRINGLKKSLGKLNSDEINLELINELELLDLFKGVYEFYENKKNN